MDYSYSFFKNTGHLDQHISYMFVILRGPKRDCRVVLRDFFFQICTIKVTGKM